MHHSRLCAVLIDCKISDVDKAARFWGEALGRPVDLAHPSVEIQRVDHESRVHIDGLIGRGRQHAVIAATATSRVTTSLPRLSAWRSLAQRW
jgi:hypothetical protein